MTDLLDFAAHKARIESAYHIDPTYIALKEQLLEELLIHIRHPTPENRQRITETEAAIDAIRAEIRAR